MVGLQSWAHPVDRLGAVPLTALQVYKCFVAIPSRGASVLELVWLWAAVGVGVGYKLCGTRAIMTRDMARYRHCHTAWHLVLPLGLAAFNGYRWRAAQLEGRCSA